MIKKYRKWPWTFYYVSLYLVKVFLFIDIHVLHWSYLYQWICFCCFLSFRRTTRQKLRPLFILSLLYRFLYPDFLPFDLACASFSTFFGCCDLSEEKRLHFYCQSCFIFHWLTFLFSKILICFNLLACWPRTTKKPKTITTNNGSKRCPTRLTTGLFLNSVIFA